MNRRSFLTSMLAAAVAPMWLPGADRVWRPNREIVCERSDVYVGYSQPPDHLPKTLIWLKPMWVFQDSGVYVFNQSSARWERLPLAHVRIGKVHWGS